MDLAVRMQGTSASLEQVGISQLSLPCSLPVQARHMCCIAYHMLVTVLVSGPGAKAADASRSCSRQSLAIRPNKQGDCASYTLSKITGAQPSADFSCLCLQLHRQHMEWAVNFAGRVLPRVRNDVSPTSTDDLTSDMFEQVLSSPACVVPAHKVFHWACRASLAHPPILGNEVYPPHQAA